jgi:hypothetical protein
MSSEPDDTCEDCENTHYLYVSEYGACGCSCHSKPATELKSATINYEVVFKYNVLRGNPTEAEVLEILEKNFPIISRINDIRIIGKDDADHFTNGSDDERLPIDDYHESWTTLLRVHFWSWNGRREG